MRAGPPQRTPGSAKNRCQNPGNNAIFLDLGGSFGKAQTRGNLQLLIFHLGRPTKKKIKKSTFWWRRNVLLCWPNKMENYHIWGLCYIFIECSSGHPCQYPDEHYLFCGIGSGHVLGHVVPIKAREGLGLSRHERGLQETWGGQILKKPYQQDKIGTYVRSLLSVHLPVPRWTCLCWVYVELCKVKAWSWSKNSQVPPWNLDLRASRSQCFWGRVDLGLCWCYIVGPCRDLCWVWVYVTTASTPPLAQNC